MKGFKDTTKTRYSKGGGTPGPKGAALISQTMREYRQGKPSGCGCGGRPKKG